MGSLTITNLVIISGAMAIITYLGHVASRKHADSSRTFFTADGGLPWWAVSASLYATAISAVSFVSLPASVFRDGGNLELAQIDFGSMLGKYLMAVLFVRAYYESRSVDTVYDYVAVRISKLVSRAVLVIAFALTIGLYSIVVLAAALVLDVLADLSIPTSCVVIVAFSVLWSWLGGIRTVVWTDFGMLCLFLFGAALSAFITFSSTGLSGTEVFALLDGNAKMKLLDLSVDPSNSYTLWTALFSATIGGAALASTQSGMQRVRACHSVQDAEKAFKYSMVFYVVAALLYVVGMGLFVFYDTIGIPEELAARVANQPDQIFPYFIVSEVPDGFSGLMIAAIFAAAISTVNSRLAELSDVSVANVYRRYIRKAASEAHYLSVARLFIILWGLVFCAVSIGVSMIEGQNLLELTFVVWNALIGPMMGIFFLARIRLGGTLSVAVGVVLSLAFVYISREQGITSFWSVPASLIIMTACAWVQTPRRFDRTGVVLNRDTAVD